MDKYFEEILKKSLIEDIPELSINSVLEDFLYRSPLSSNEYRWIEQFENTDNLIEVIAAIYYQEDLIKQTELWGSCITINEKDDSGNYKITICKISYEERRKRDHEYLLENANDTKLFLSSYEWQTLRFEVIEKYGNRCMCCGRTPNEGIYINVDHIYPRKNYPEMALNFNNLQILCNECNKGKGNKVKDFRS